jgi:hypothetical protein
LSVPYEHVRGSAESPETPQELLARLLARALNSFELPDELLERLNTALAHDSSLHSAHHSAGLHRITYRHTWLLADGSAFVLWELAHNTGRQAEVPRPAETGQEPTGPADQQGQPTQRRPRHPLHGSLPLYDSLVEPQGPEPQGPEAQGPEAQAPDPLGGQDSCRQLHEWRDRRWRHDQYELYTGDEQLRAALKRLPLPLDEALGTDMPFTGPLPAMPLPRHVYVPDNSADHARRLLRRAENADRPGTALSRLLGTAAAHQITQAFGRPALSSDARLAFSLYEHAFLLADGREISLWEVEHTATPDGRHMCEVYTSESAARKAMELRASQAN